MSMISAQIDELRRMADGQATYREARAVMLQAADTILELRKDLEFADNECEKESIEFLNLQAENAKLRELVRDMMGFFEDGDWCVKCERARDCQAQEQYEGDCLMRFVFRNRMRELGIEVDG